MPWRRLMFVFTGLGFCAAGCAVSPSSPDSGSTDAAAVRDEPVRLVTIVEAPATGPAVTFDDVIDWSVRGVTDNLIIARIRQTHSIFHLSAAQQSKLHDAGVSDTVVRAMGATAWD